jgi:D-alanine-D-alanine ligase
MGPQVVFNLVEALAGVGSRASVFPRLFERLGVAYTGSGPGAMDLTTDKPSCKRRLVEAGIDTPPWAKWRDSKGLARLIGRAVIIKPTTEDASMGIEDASVARDEDARGLIRTMARRSALLQRKVFAETYVPGREINVSLLAGAAGEEPEVLPPAEITFEGFPPDKPHIVGYDAKWQQDSFAYRHTPRRFLDAADDVLRRQLASVAVRCWHECGLRGYGRVDFRVDADSRPWVIEVNANPCLADDAGFMAAAHEAELSAAQVVDRLLRAAAVSLAAGV